jgi:hypothetical protein
MLPVAQIAIGTSRDGAEAFPASGHPVFAKLHFPVVYEVSQAGNI